MGNLSKAEGVLDQQTVCGSAVEGLIREVIRAYDAAADRDGPIGIGDMVINTMCPERGVGKVHGILPIDWTASSLTIRAFTVHGGHNILGPVSDLRRATAEEIAAEEAAELDDKIRLRNAPEEELSPLEKSIRHYDRLETGEDVWIDDAHCALCGKYFLGRCKGCPIKNAVGGCVKSPWKELSDHAIRAHPPKGCSHEIHADQCPECRRLVRKMGRFLRSLRPGKAEKVEKKAPEFEVDQWVTSDEDWCEARRIAQVVSVEGDRIDYKPDLAKSVAAEEGWERSCKLRHATDEEKFRRGAKVKVVDDGNELITHVVRTAYHHHIVAYMAVDLAIPMGATMTIPVSAVELLEPAPAE